VAQLEILDCFDRPPSAGGTGEQLPRREQMLTAADIISRTGLPRSSVFRDLRHLTQTGFLYQDGTTKRYALGRRILQLGMTVRQQLSSEDLIAVPLLELVNRTHETVTFSLLDLPSRICVFRIEAPSELRQFAQIGARYPLHLGAAGKAILAYLSPDLVAEVLKSHDVDRAREAEIATQLARIRETGYAITSGERVEGVSSTAAPVFVGDAIFGSVAIAGPSDRIRPALDRYTEHVVEVAQQLSWRLSDRGQPVSPAAAGRRSKNRPKQSA
jgi:IclR family transcriptional regulator, acetate operon repressor